MTGGYLLLILFVSILPMPSWCLPKHVWPLTKDTILWDKREDDKSVSTFVNDVTCPLLASDSLYGGEDHGSFYYDGSTASVADFGVMSDKENERKDKYGFTLWLKPDSATSTGEIFEYKSTLDEINRVTRARAEMVNGKVKFTVTNINGDMGSVKSSVGVDDTKFNNVLLWANEADKKMRLHVAVNGQEDYYDTYVDTDDMKLQLGGKWRLGEFVTSSGTRYAGKINCISFYDNELKPDELDKYMEDCDKDMDRYPGVNACRFDRTPEIRTERFKLFARNKAPNVTSSPPMTSIQTSSVVKCAGRCLRTLHCKSFTFSSGNVTSSCSLFDVVTVTGLVDLEGNYYRITSE